MKLCKNRMHSKNKKKSQVHRVSEVCGQKTDLKKK